MDFELPLTGVLQSRTTSKNVKSIKSKQDTFQKKLVGISFEAVFQNLKKNSKNYLSFI